MAMRSRFFRLWPRSCARHLAWMMAVVSLSMKLVMLDLKNRYRSSCKCAKAILKSVGTPDTVGSVAWVLRSITGVPIGVAGVFAVAVAAGGGAVRGSDGRIGQLRALGLFFTRFLVFLPR